jgi:acetyl esterase/lipase
VNLLERLDPELRIPLSSRPILDLSDLGGAREQYCRILGAESGTSRSEVGVSVTDHTIMGRDPESEILIRVFRPTKRASDLPCLFWIQGGGFVLDSTNMDDGWCVRLVGGHGCIVTSVRWRRAPEFQFPAPLEDCYAGLSWLVQNADRQGVDATRIVVGGNSSGGGLAAALALLVRDRGELRLQHQLLVYPMLDDTNSTFSAHAVTYPRVWNRANNMIAWRLYLGRTLDTGEVSPYAAPARMEDLSGLPAASVFTGELDLFVDEDIVYAQRLIQAGVRTELHVYPGAVHGFDRFAPQAAVSRRFYADCDAVLSASLTRRCE